MPTLLRRAGRQKSVQLRTQKIDEQRHEESPGQNAARKLDSSQSGPDDIAHSQISRTDTGRGETTDATGGQKVVGTSAAKPDAARAELTYAYREIGVCREYSEFPDKEY